MLNEGMFAGQEGWVLKPEGYRGSRPSLDSKGQVKEVSSACSTPMKQTLNLDIQLLAAQGLQSPTDKQPSHLKPYIKCQLHIDTHGPPGQGKNGSNGNAVRSDSDAYGDDQNEEKKYKRRSKTYRSDSPDFGNEPMSWVDVPDVVDELSFFRLKIMDDRAMGKDHLLAWACIRLDRLQGGYRLIHLMDATGNPSIGVLLVKISKHLA